MPYVAFLPDIGGYLNEDEGEFFVTSNPELAETFETPEDCRNFLFNYDWHENDASGVVVPQRPKYYNCGKLPNIDGALVAIRYFLPLGMYANCEGGKIVISYHEANDEHFRILTNVGNLITTYLENI